MAENINLEGTPISRLPRETNPADVDVVGTKSGRTVKISLNLVGGSGADPNIEVHNADPSAHPAIREKISTDIAAHNTNADAHPGFMSRERPGIRGTNTLSSEQLDNIGSNLVANFYGNGFTVTKYIAAHRVDSATYLREIITKHGGSDTAMPGYWGICVDPENGNFFTRTQAFVPGIFFFSLNDEDNKATWPMKISVFDATGARKAYFRNDATPVMTAWQDLTGATSAIAEHNASDDGSTHPHFMSRGRPGSKAGSNPYSSEQTDNIGSNIAANFYGNGFTVTKYIGARRVDSATYLRDIVSFHGGSDTTMPGYWGICVDPENGNLFTRTQAFVPGIFFFSLNDEENRATWPMKIAVYDATGARKAYFRNDATPTMTEWEDIGGTTLTGYREDWASPNDAGIPTGHGNIQEWGMLKQQSGSSASSSFLIHRAWRGGAPDDPQVIIASQMQIFTDGIIRTREMFTTTGNTTWGEWKEIGAPATTTQAGTVTLASNTGNSTDAGKVPALGTNGKLSTKVLPDETLLVSESAAMHNYLTESGLGVYDIYRLTYKPTSSAPIIIYLPTTLGCGRRRIKIRVELVNTSSNPSSIYVVEAGGTKTVATVAAGATVTSYIIAEHFGNGEWRVS